MPEKKTTPGTRLARVTRPAVKQNLIDKAVGYFAPGAALKRLQARSALALVGGYAGASKSRRGLSGYRTFGGGPEYDLHHDLPTLRERSRDLYRNTPLARGAVNEKVSFVVGPGHIVDPQVDRDFLGLSLDEAEEWEGRAAQVFRAYARTENIHVGRQMNFADLEALTLLSVLLSGDLLIFDRFKRRTGVPFSTCLQLVEGDRLQNPGGGSDNENVSGGVRRDDDGEPVEYYVLDQHPGEVRVGASRSGRWFKAFGPDGRRRVNHLFFHKRPGQVRGEPFLAPVIEALKQLDRYSEAELMAAVVNSCFAITTSTESGDGLDLPAPIAGKQTPEQTEISLTQSGTIVDLAPDEKVESFTPGRPSAAFDPFFRSIVSQMAVALDTTEETLMRSFKASYSASRGAIEVAYRFAQGYETWLISKFCQPVYESVISEAVAQGILNAPGFFADPFRRAAWLGAMWTGPARLSLNPKAEAEADKVDLELGVVDKYRIAAKRGLIFDNVANNRAKSQRREVTLGLRGGASSQETNDTEDEDPPPGSDDESEAEDD